MQTASNLFSDKPDSSIIPEAVPSASPDKGMEVITQNPIDNVSAITSLSNSTTSVQNTSFNNEQPWNITNVSNKPLFIQTLDWTPAQTPGTVLGTIESPICLLSTTGNDAASNHLADLLARFTYCRFNMEFRVFTNTTMFDSGRIKFSALPPSPAEPYDVNRYMTTPGIDFNAKDCNSFTFTLPWSIPTPYLATNRQLLLNAMPKLTAYVIQPLRLKAGAGTSRSFSIYAVLKNPVFKVPQIRNINVPTFTSWQLSTSTAQDNFQAASQTLESQLFDLTLKKKFAVTQSASYDVPVDDLIASSGPSVTLGYKNNPNGLHTVTENTLDELDISHLVSQTSMIRNLTITSDMPRATRLFTIPVHPMVEPINCPNVFTNLQYISNAFQFWSGDLAYRCSFGKTKFTKGKIAITFIADDNFEAPVTDQQILSGEFYRQIFDVVDSSEYSFSIPYINNLPMSQVGDVTSHDAHSIGRLYFHIETPFTISETNTITDMTVWSGATSSFRLYEPRPPQVLNLISLGNNGAPTQAQLITLRNNMTTVFRGPATPRKRSFDYATTQSLSDISSYRFEEDPAPLFVVPSTSANDQTMSDLTAITNLKQLLIRPSNFYELRFTPTQDVAAFYNCPTGTDVVINYIKYFARLFAFWSGDLKYKVIFNADKNANYSLYVKYIAGLADSSSLNFNFVTGHPGMRFNVAHNPIVNFTIPYHTKYPALYVKSHGTIELPLVDPSFHEYYTTGFIQMNILPQAGVYPTVAASMYQYAGDDFKFGGFRGVPNNIIRDLVVNINQIVTGRYDLGDEITFEFYQDFLNLSTIDLRNKYLSYRAANVLTLNSGDFYRSNVLGPTYHMFQSSYSDVGEPDPGDLTLDFTNLDTPITVTPNNFGALTMDTNLLPWNFPPNPGFYDVNLPDLVVTMNGVDTPFTISQIYVQINGTTIINGSPTIEQGVTNSIPAQPVIILLTEIALASSGQE